MGVVQAEGLEVGNGPVPPYSTPLANICFKSQLVVSQIHSFPLTFRYYRLSCYWITSLVTAFNNRLKTTINMFTGLQLV